MKDLREAINNEEKENDQNPRGSLIKDHENALQKKSTIVGVLPEDITKKGFGSQSLTGSDSGAAIGPDGKKISYSYDGDNDRSLLYEYQERNNNQYG